ncbi:hypothetical protein PF006_g16850 [Phytophthora fragariae]|uniref:Uncharacterized protein n=1 Tax=Phytophthora fragariae TaxID=53985 RepID=A0A6A3SYC1_9STRA|nr:hypothetical protein PF006_g16850 [Phytophthora fragariae]
MTGQVEVANFLRKRCGQPAITLALKLAAEAKARTRWPSRIAWGTLLLSYVAVHDVSFLEAAFKAAAANGHIETAELLLKTKSSYGPTGVASALEDAMSIGHFTVVRLLTRSDNPCSTTFALARAASTGDVQAAKLSVHRSDRNAVIRAACVAMGKSIALQQQQLLLPATKQQCSHVHFNKTKD